MTCSGSGCVTLGDVVGTTYRASQGALVRDSTTSAIWRRIIEITIAPDQLDDPTSVRIVGDLDLASILSFRTTALSLEGRANADLCLDLSAVTFMDCAGLGALEEWSAAVSRRGGTTTITSVSPDVKRVLSMTWTTLSEPAR